MVEFPLSGGAVPSHDLNVIRLRRYMNQDDENLVILEGVVLIFLFLHMWAEWTQVLVEIMLSMLVFIVLVSGDNSDRFPCFRLAIWIFLDREQQELQLLQLRLQHHGLCHHHPGSRYHRHSHRADHH